ncbi:MAG: hypothetical protein ABJA10_07065 [Aestuariivirga sp.]
MRRIAFIILAGGLFASPALADKAAYCQAYARDFSDQTATDKATWQHKFQIALDACLAGHKQVAKSAPVKAVAPAKQAVAKPAPAPQEPVDVKPASATLVAGTPEWNDYCTKKYTSFSEKTGMYMSKTGVARKCLVTPDFKG